MHHEVAAMGNHQERITGRAFEGFSVVCFYSFDGTTLVKYLQVVILNLHS